MNVSLKTAKETASGLEPDCILVFLFVLLASALLFFRLVPAHSPVALQRPARFPSRSVSPRQIEVVGEEARRDSLETVVVNDGSVESTASITKQDLGPSTRYTLHVLLPGGGDQVIRVSAPPGGLQFEIRDMTGDNVRNDLLVRPALIHWPLMVLVNDGHDHFTGAILNSFPGSFDSGKQASEKPQFPSAVALGFFDSVVASLAVNGLPIPEPDRGFLSLFNSNLIGPAEYKFLSGRAPPPISTRI